jgi:hypothetical protein
MGAVLLFGGLAGVVLALSFRRFANHAAIRRLRRRLWAHVLELRLFGEEPALAFGSLWGTAQTNLRLLAHALPPLLIAAPVIGLLAVPLSEFFTRTPLQTGGDTVLTVRLRRDAEVRLQTPSWVVVDAPPVHIPAAREISWRLRATAAKVGRCTISAAGETVAKELDARPGLHYSGAVRSTSWTDWLLHPAESRLLDGPVERVWISPVPAPLRCAGLTLDWGEWFAAMASVTAWLLHFFFRRP